MKYSGSALILLIFGFLFGKYPVGTLSNNISKVSVEMRNYDCIEAEDRKYVCPVVKVDVTSAEDLEYIYNEFKTVWCPFVPLSFEGTPFYNLKFTYVSGDVVEYAIRNNEVSNGCFSPIEIIEYLADITDKTDIVIEYENL